MSVLFYLICLTFIIALLGIIGVFWSIKHKQFEDVDGAARRILTRDQDE